MVLQQLWDRNMQELISGLSHDKSVRLHSAPAGLTTPLHPTPVDNRGIVGNVVWLILPQK